MTVPNTNVTPLIDVLLVLLIIFTVITPKKPHQFDSQIPQKIPEDQPERVDLLSLVITIPAPGGFMLSQTWTPTREERGDLLLTALDGRPADRKPAFFKAPRSLAYGNVIKVVDVAKGAGAFPIGLLIEGLEGGPGIG